MGTILKEILPFIVEYFFNNSELKKEVKSPGFLAKFLLMLSILAFLLYGSYWFASELLATSYKRGQKLNEQLAFVDEVAEDLRIEKNTIEKKYRELDLKYYESKKTIIDLENKNIALEQTLALLQSELDKCVGSRKVLNDKRVPAPTTIINPKPTPRPNPRPKDKESSRETLLMWENIK